MNYCYETLDLCLIDFEHIKIDNAFFLSQYHKVSNNKLKNQIFASYLLLKNMLKKQKIDLDKCEISANKFGKPYFTTLNLFFNISHSNNLCACAISSTPIGIDIQAYSKPNRKIQQRYFNKTSKRRMFFSLNKTRSFTKGWTTYESNLKLFSNQRFNQGKTNTKFHYTTDSQNQKFIIAISVEK